jgi:hypothetical protein
MTKILYLPTNEYIKFWIDDGDIGTGFKTTKVENAGNYYEPAFSSPEDAIAKICACTSNALLFLTANNITHLPILREELEISYDE